MSIKILQVTAAYKPAYIYGGPTMSVAKLCETLVETSILDCPSFGEIKETNNEQRTTNNDIFDLEVLTTTANGKTELNILPNKSMLVDGVKVTYFKRLTKDHTHFSPTLLLALRSEILNSAKQEKSIIIHIHAWWNLVSLFSCAIAKWYNVPVVLTPRGMLTAYTTTNRNSLAKKIIHNILGKSLLKYCHIHATSEKEKRDILSIIKPKSITVIANLVELGIEQVQSFTVYRPSFDETLPTNNEQRTTISKVCTFQLIFLSRIEEKKGLELLFEALTNLPFSYHLTIGGSGQAQYVERLKVKAETLKISDKITWAGQVKNEDKFKLLAKHDLMILTSYDENFANVVIESLSVGTPVLLSNEVGLADYVEEKKLGWITDLTPDNIKNNIILTFESAELRNIIREKAPLIIRKDFDSKILIKKYFTLYSQIN